MPQYFYLHWISFFVSFFFLKVVNGHFGPAQSKGILDDKEIKEASGLACSRNKPGYFWTHNDSGDQARFFLLDSTGRCRASYYLQHTEARDWEDMGMMQRNGKSYLLFGDIGDNFGVHTFSYLHQVEEPTVWHQRTGVDTIPQQAIKTYTLQYEDGPRDAESFFYDPQDKKLYVISKRELHVGVYETALPEDNRDTLVLRRRISLPYTFITSADISPDGREVVIKNLLHIYYWKRKQGESIVDMFKREGEIQPYEAEPQGEAIAFAPDGAGYYTTSERPFGLTAHLYFYPRMLR